MSEAKRASRPTRNLVRQVIINVLGLKLARERWLSPAEITDLVVPRLAKHRLSTTTGAVGSYLAGMVREGVVLEREALQGRGKVYRINLGAQP